MMNFRDLGLTAPILRALTQEGYTDPTPIQRQAIPPALAGRDWAAPRQALEKPAPLPRPSFSG